jgi:hypothetical protein
LHCYSGCFELALFFNALCFSSLGSLGCLLSGSFEAAFLIHEQLVLTVHFHLYAGAIDGFSTHPTVKVKITGASVPAGIPLKLHTGRAALGA